MKKLVMCFILLVCTLGAKAQFEKNKWFVNPSVTGLDLSFNDGAHLGIQANGGAFLADNWALLLNVGGKYGDGSGNITTLGVGGRYYTPVGVYVGLGMNYNHYAKWKDNDFGAVAEVGYAFFLSRTVTIEPGIYYNQSFTDHSAYSKFGLKVGFGFYF